MDLLFPDIGREVAWTRPPEFLDTELQKITPEAEGGRGAVDKLVRVWTVDGVQEEVFVHVEVQNQRDAGFAHRMYRYNHRLEDRYGRMPVSIAVLGDDDRWWRPEEFQAGRLGCRVKFHFPVVKLLDYAGRVAELEATPNPFAAFILVHLMTNETRGNADARLGWKLRIVKQLYGRGMSHADIHRTFRLVDWVMAVPPPQAREFERELRAFEEEKEMPIITPTEKLWLEDGIAKGRLDGIEAALDIRFGAEGLALMPQVRQLTDPTILDTILRTLRTGADLDAVRNLLPPQA